MGQQGVIPVYPQSPTGIYTPDLPLVFPPTLLTARAVIALIDIVGSEPPHPGPPSFRSPGVAGGLFKLGIKLVFLECTVGTALTR